MIDKEIKRKEIEVRIQINEVRSQHVGHVQKEERKWQQDTLKWLHIAKRQLQII
jgi:hypothetical protein